MFIALSDFFFLLYLEVNNLFLLAILFIKISLAFSFFKSNELQFLNELDINIFGEFSFSIAFLSLKFFDNKSFKYSFSIGE